MIAKIIQYISTFSGDALKKKHKKKPQSIL